MATYKVIQDIEAEDKFIGPFTLKQFLFAAGAALFGYLNFFAATKGAYFLFAVFTPPMLLGAFLAFPWSKEQSTEVWVLAKLRYRIKPKTRIWDQAGLEQLVTITVPKKIERQLTNGLDQYEVESRLKALAETIDTRGWATKNATLQTAYALPQQTEAQRLINLTTLPQQVPDVDTSAYTDVMDEKNVVSENFDQMIQASEQKHRQESLERMEQVRQTGQIPRAVEPQIQFAPPTESYAQPSPVDEALVSQQLRNNSQSRNVVNSHLKTIPTTPQATQPVTVQQPVVVEEPEQAQAEMTKTSSPDIIDLSRNNDLNVETIARQANKKAEFDDGEVVISLR